MRRRMLTAPSVPVNVLVTAVSDVTVSLVWDASTDDTGVAGYRVFRDGVDVGTTSELVFTDRGWMRRRRIRTRCRRLMGCRMSRLQSAPVDATTDATPDVTAPSVPVNVLVTGVSDVVGVVGVGCVDG